MRNKSYSINISNKIENFNKNILVDSDKSISIRSFLISSVSKTRKVTPIQLMEIIKKIIDTEKSKLSDQDISIILNKKGYSLARRTISKYRLKLNIPSSRKR